MGNMSFVFLIIIIIYLLFAFIQNRKEKEKKQSILEKKGVGLKSPFLEEKVSNAYEAAVVTAAIAAIMGDTAYKIKRVYVMATVDEKKSSWKISGRNENMMRRVFFKS